MSLRARVGLLLLLAFLLRLVAVFWLCNPTPDIVADADWYHRTATALAAGSGYIHPFTGQPTAAWPPGYPAVLAVVYRMFGANPLWAFLLNAVAGTLSCLLAGLIARLLISARAQVVTTALLALLPSHILFTSLVMSETIYTTVMTALVLAAVQLLQRKSPDTTWTGWLLWGFAVGLASLIRAEAVVLLFGPPVVLFASRCRPARIGAILVLTVAASIVAQLPWLGRNAALFGRIVPVSSSFGRTFLIGHNPEAEGGMNLYSPDPEADLRDLAGGGPAGELAVDNRLRAEGLRYLREHPKQEVLLLGKRLRHMYRSDRVWSEWFVPAQGSALRPATVEALGLLSNLYYWILLALAAPALFRFTFTRNDAGLLLPVLVGGWTAFFVLILYGSTRFHFPLLPLLCVMAADTVVQGRWLRLPGSSPAKAESL